MASSSRSSIWRLATARAISDTGSWAAAVALALEIYARTGSTVWLSMGFLFTKCPAALLSPVAGIIADRLNRKRVMIGCDLLGAACYVVMAFTGEPAMLIAIGALASVLHVPFGPSSSASVPNLVPEEELSWANGIVAGAGGVGTLLGPALAGTLAAFFHGAGPVFSINAASFIVSALLVLSIGGRFSSTESRPEPATESRGAQAWAGWRYLSHRPVLLILTIVGAVTFLAAEIGWVLIFHSFTASEQDRSDTG